MKNLLIDYVSYNDWANKKIIEIVKVNQALATQTTPNSFPTIQKTLLHIADAQIIWLNRLKGVILTAFPSDSFTGTIEEVFEIVVNSSEDFLAYIKKEGAVLFDTSISYSTTTGKHYTTAKSEIVQHCMNHSTYHRGQVITMLHQLGGIGFEQTDYIAYLREKDK